MEARFATPVTMRGQYTAMWDGDCGEGHLHIARRDMGPMTECPDLFSPEAEGWAGACERCALPINWDASCDCDDDCPATDGGSCSATTRIGSGTKTTWDTPSGDLEPGCLYYGQNHDYCSGLWTNCDGRHLYAVLPNGHHWDIDSRARNCGSPQDFIHRCWIRHGEPPSVHVDKSGATCSAGAGSIASGDYHGFLHDGQFTDA
jgi:hypothetical protein